MNDPNAPGQTKPASNSEGKTPPTPFRVLPLPYEVPESHNFPTHLPAWNTVSASILILFTCGFGLLTGVLLAAIASAIRTRHSDAGQVCLLTICAAVMSIATVGCGIRAKTYVRRARHRDN